MHQQWFGIQRQWQCWQHGRAFLFWRPASAMIASSASASSWYFQAYLMLSCASNNIATSKRVGMIFCFISLLIYFFQSQQRIQYFICFRLWQISSRNFSVMHKNQNQSKVVKTRELALSLLRQLGETREISHLPKWNQTKILHRIYYLLFSSDICLQGSVRIRTRFSSHLFLLKSASESISWIF